VSPVSTSFPAGHHDIVSNQTTVRPSPPRHYVSIMSLLNSIRRESCIRRAITPRVNRFESG